ncbi:hypothetical protein, partial [Roseiconus lacunae]
TLLFPEFTMFGRDPVITNVPLTPKPVKRKATSIALTLLVACVALGLVLHFPRGESDVELGLRTDLKISEVWRVRLIDKTSFPSMSRRHAREEALFVRSGGRKHILALAYRHPNSPSKREAQWMIAETSMMFDDGHDEWIRHERTFYHFPSRDEIAQFRDDAPWY